MKQNPSPKKHIQPEWIFLDTARAGTFRVGVLGKVVNVKEHTGRSNKILPALEKRISPERLRGAAGVCVVSGPGSFSAVRTGTLVANLLARGLKLPLYGVEVAEAEDLERLSERLVAGEIPSSGYVAPVYDAEPNITMPRTTDKKIKT